MSIVAKLHLCVGCLSSLQAAESSALSSEEKAVGGAQRVQFQDQSVCVLLLYGSEQHSSGTAPGHSLS